MTPAGLALYCDNLPCCTLSIVQQWNFVVVLLFFCLIFSSESGVVNVLVT